MQTRYNCNQFNSLIFIYLLTLHYVQIFYITQFHSMFLTYLSNFRNFQMTDWKKKTGNSSFAFVDKFSLSLISYFVYNCVYAMHFNKIKFEHTKNLSWNILLRMVEIDLPIISFPKSITLISHWAINNWKCLWKTKIEKKPISNSSQFSTNKY